MPQFSARESFLSWYHEEKIRLDTELSSLSDSITQNEAIAFQYQTYADLLMVSLPLSLTVGQQFVQVSNLQGNAIDIPVDIVLSLQQNEQVYYDKRRIVLQKVVHLQERADKLQDKLANLKKQYALQNDEHFLAAKSWLIGKKNKISLSKGFVLPGVRVYTLLVGKSAQENDFLLRHVVKAHEWWFHVRDYSGSYVFIRTKKDKYSRRKFNWMLVL